MNAKDKEIRNPAAHATQQSFSPGRDEQVIRELDAEWSLAAENKDATEFASFYSDTGSALPF